MTKEEAIQEASLNTYVLLAIVQLLVGIVLFGFGSIFGGLFQFVLFSISSYMIYETKYMNDMMIEFNYRDK